MTQEGQKKIFKLRALLVEALQQGGSCWDTSWRILVPACHGSVRNANWGQSDMPVWRTLPMVWWAFPAQQKLGLPKQLILNSLWLLSTLSVAAHETLSESNKSTPNLYQTHLPWAVLCFPPVLSDLKILKSSVKIYVTDRFGGFYFMTGCAVRKSWEVWGA